MARARRSSQAAPKPDDTQTQTADQFTCPECGKTFTRAASLGAHRNRAHGIAGTSKKTPTARKRRRATTNTSRRTRSTNTSPARRSDGATTDINRDALLQAIFPNGLPAREAVIRAANDWLDRAEQLAKLN